MTYTHTKRARGGERRRQKANIIMIYNDMLHNHTRSYLIHV